MAVGLSEIPGLIKVYGSAIESSFRAWRNPSSIPGQGRGKNLVFIQTGDYYESYSRLSAGGKTNYFGQLETVQFVAMLAKEWNVTVISAPDEYARKRTPNGITCVGLDIYGRPIADLLRLLDEEAPDAIVLRLPILPVVRWALERRIDILPLLADSFASSSWKARASNARFGLLLSHHGIEFVGNHARAAAEELARIGVPRHKILAYDWRASIDGSRFKVREHPPEGPVDVTYVGQVIESKGIFDVIEAVALLKREGIDVHLRVIGRGERDLLKDRAAALGVADQLSLLGALSHEEVLQTLARGHFAVTPSRHEYPEGKPMTLYEALVTKTPLICSDHPMFRYAVKNGTSALVFRAGDPRGLASSLRQAVQDPALYTQLSEGAAQAAETFFDPLKWDMLLTAWLDPELRPMLKDLTLEADPSVRRTPPASFDSFAPMRDGSMFVWE